MDNFQPIENVNEGYINVKDLTEPFKLRVVALETTQKGQQLDKDPKIFVECRLYHGLDLIADPLRTSSKSLSSPLFIHPLAFNIIYKNIPKVLPSLSLLPSSLPPFNLSLLPSPCLTPRFLFLSLFLLPLSLPLSFPSLSLSLPLPALLFLFFLLIPFFSPNNHRKRVPCRHLFLPLSVVVLLAPFPPQIIFFYTSSPLPPSPLSLD